MRKKRVRRLVLNRETLLDLDSRTLHGVAGGITVTNAPSDCNTNCATNCICGSITCTQGDHCTVHC